MSDDTDITRELRGVQRASNQFGEGAVYTVVGQKTVDIKNITYGAVTLPTFVKLVGLNNYSTNYIILNYNPGTLGTAGVSFTDAGSFVAPWAEKVISFPNFGGTGASGATGSYEKVAFNYGVANTTGGFVRGLTGNYLYITYYRA